MNDSPGDWPGDVPGAAVTVLTRLCAAVDAHAWEALPALLQEGFVCRYVHTGETFSRDAWVRLNAGYPGFERMRLEDVVGSEDRAAARCHVTAQVDGAPAHFEVATFVRVRDGRIVEMTEVWTDVAQAPPSGTRPD